MESQTDPKVKYQVRCYSCQNPFDALEANWCSCLSSTRTLACPSCFACFCEAPKSYKDTFWSQAPEPMWKRKMEERGLVPQQMTRPNPDTLRRPLVLIAEDEPAIQRVAVAAVASLGYSVLLAHNGAEALEMARLYRPELLLSDALMPKMDGREVCRQLKADDKTSAIKVVVMTSAFTANKYKSEAVREFQVDEYLPKPLSFKTLRALLQRFLG